MSDHDTWDDEHVDGSKRARTAGEDPGAYIGHEPERATETIPGGVQPQDERVSAVASQPGPVVDDGTPPGGHRTSERANDDRIREAGDRE
jgi:hypothetical protein